MIKSSIDTLPQSYNEHNKVYPTKTIDNVTESELINWLKNRKYYWTTTIAKRHLDDSLKYSEEIVYGEDLEISYNTYEDPDEEPDDILDDHNCYHDIPLDFYGLCNRFRYFNPRLTLSSFQSWLTENKSFWNGLQARRGPLQYKYKTNEIQEISFEQRQSNAQQGGCEWSQPIVMSYDGFDAIGRILHEIHPMDVTMPMSEPNSPRVVNPSYRWADCPLPGWTKIVQVRMNGKNVGTTDVTYQSPENEYGTRNLRSKNDLQVFLTQNGYSLQILSKFDYRNVFCLCHQPEDSNHVYLECSLGLAGCRGWLHSECVGLGILSDSQMEAMETVVCPLCTIYLEGSNQGSLLEGKLPLRRITCPVPPSVSYVNNFAIEEYKRPHESYGLEYSQYIWNRGKITSPVAPSIIRSNSIKPERAIEKKSPIIEESKRQESESAKKREYEELLKRKAKSKTQDTKEIKDIKQSQKELPILKHRLFENLLFGGVFVGGENKQRVDNYEEFSKDDNKDNDFIDVDAPIKLRVIGGWMRRDGDEKDSEKRKDKYHRMWHGGVDRNMEKYDNRNENDFHFMSDEEIIKKKAKNNVPVSLNSQFKNGLIEAAMELSQSSVNSRLKSNSQLNDDSFQNYQPYISNPKICHLPLEDGGIRSTCLVPAYVPKSLHLYCDSACAYCMTKIPDWKIDECKTGSPRSKRKKKRSGKKKKDGEYTSSDESDYNDAKAFDVVEKSVGVFNYRFHRQCHALFENKDSLIAIINNSSEDEETSSSIEKYITIKNYHENKSVDDVICDLCGRPGGVMQYFFIDPDATVVNSPRTEGWCGHIPCIYWLYKSSLLSIRKKPSPLTLLGQAQNRVNDRAQKFAKLLENARHDENDEIINNDKQNSLENEVMTSKNYISGFDELLGLWNCSLCGLREGISIRCSSSACTVRAHPLCAAMAGSPWQLCSININEPNYNYQETGENDDRMTYDDNINLQEKNNNYCNPTISLICSIHGLQ